MHMSTMRYNHLNCCCNAALPACLPAMLNCLRILQLLRSATLHLAQLLVPTCCVDAKHRHDQGLHTATAAASISCASDTLRTGQVSINQPLASMLSCSMLHDADAGNFLHSMWTCHSPSLQELHHHTAHQEDTHHQIHCLCVSELRLHPSAWVHPETAEPGWTMCRWCIPF